ncbi:hypothetical protein [Tissierella carlieri]|nr:hypothetical protein [Tissierella carlieri]
MAKGIKFNSTWGAFSNESKKIMAWLDRNGYQRMYSSLDGGEDGWKKNNE